MGSAFVISANLSSMGEHHPDRSYGDPLYPSFGARYACMDSEPIKDLIEEKMRDVKRTYDDTADYLRTVSLYIAKYLGIYGVSGVVTGAFVTAAGLSPGLAFGTLAIGAGFGFYHTVMMSMDNNRTDYHASMMHVGLGMSLGPVLAMMPPHIIVSSVVVTGIAMTVPVMGSYLVPRESLKSACPYLGMGLLACIGMGIGGFFIPGLHQIEIYGGIALFTLLTGYDLQMAIDDFENGKIAPEFHAAKLSLDAINLFIRIMEAMAQAEANKKGGLQRRMMGEDSFFFI